MAGLVPAIHDLFPAWAKDVDARNKPALGPANAGPECAGITRENRATRIGDGFRKGSAHPTGCGCPLCAQKLPRLSPMGAAAKGQEETFSRRIRLLHTAFSLRGPASLSITCRDQAQKPSTPTCIISSAMPPMTGEATAASVGVKLDATATAITDATPTEIPAAVGSTSLTPAFWASWTATRKTADIFGSPQIRLRNASKMNLPRLVSYLK